jgi:hypothetical protein
MKVLYTSSDLGVAEHPDTEDCCPHGTYGVRESPRPALTSVIGTLVWPCTRCSKADKVERDRPLLELLN